MSIFDADHTMTSPTIGEPECFALTPRTIAEETARYTGRPAQRSMPRPPVLAPAPSMASWRGDGRLKRMDSDPETRRYRSVSGSDYSSTSMSDMDGSAIESDSGMSSITKRSESHRRHYSGLGAIDPSLLRPRPKAVVSHTLTVDAHKRIPVASGLGRYDTNDAEVDNDEQDDIVTARPKKEVVAAAPIAAKATSKTVSTRQKGSKRGKGERVYDEDASNRSSHARKQNPNHIPRPRNAFILFRKHIVDAKLIPASVEVRHQNVSVIVAKMWAEASAEQKSEFNELARIEKEDHMKRYPGYRYQPVYRRTNVIRRRVRKDEEEEERCRTVAELLLNGKSGAALEKSIHETSGAASDSKRKAKRVTQANELSKGALRALKAKAKLDAERATPDTEWSDVSRAGSSEPSGGRSRTESGRTQLGDESNSTSASRRSSMTFEQGTHIDVDLADTAQQHSHAHDLVFAHMHLQSHTQPGQIQVTWPSTLGMAASQVVTEGAFSTGQEGRSSDISGPADMPSQTFTFGGQGSVFGGNVPWSNPSQTWAFPEAYQELFPQPNQQPTFTYPQPAADRAFFTYDQALPFSPSANTFVFPPTTETRSHNQHDIDARASTTGFGYDSMGRASPAGTAYGAYGVPDCGNHAQGYGLNSTLPVPPMTARWDALYQSFPSANELPHAMADVDNMGAPWNTHGVFGMGVAGVEGSVEGHSSMGMGMGSGSGSTGIRDEGVGYGVGAGAAAAADMSNPLLQDFGSALMQAEEMFGWS